MDKWIECIPNISGTAPEIIGEICEQIQAIPGVYLLGCESDVDHNRTVITFAGSPSAVCQGAFQVISTAKRLINLNEHTGQHPRIGATDVCPLVPLINATMDDCVEIAHRLAKLVAEELEIPSFLYEEAATIPEKRNLADIRRGQFEKLRERIGTKPVYTPDYGPAQLHPTAGAVAIGARFFLIAFNVNLHTQDLKIAQKIARAIREKRGGFPGIKSLGFALPKRNQVQVSMNITDYRKTSLKTVYDDICRRAAEFDVGIAESELIGFIPEQAVEQNLRETLNLPDFSGQKILENKLAETLQNPCHSPLFFLKALASSKPTPGGGSAAALTGANAVACAQKALVITLRNKKFAQDHLALAQQQEQLEILGNHLQLLIREDSEAYRSYIDAKKMPEETDEEREQKRRALEDSLMRSALLPMDCALQCQKLLEILPKIAPIINKYLISDIGVATHLAVAAVESASLNVRINAAMIKDHNVRLELEKTIDEQVVNCRKLGTIITNIVEKRITEVK